MLYSVYFTDYHRIGVVLFVDREGEMLILVRSDAPLLILKVVEIS